MLLALLIAAAAMALSMWIFARFPDRAPGEFRPGLIHMGISMVIFYLARPLVTPAFDHLMFPLDKYALIFLLLLPALTYRFLSTLWLLNLAQRATRGRFS